MDFENPHIIDCDGQLYRVGWNEDGWFGFEPVVFTNTGLLIRDPEKAEEAVAFPPKEMRTVLQAIQQRQGI